jgi:hypothetical protein
VQQKTQIVVIVVHVKILSVNVLKNVNAILNFHAKAYKAGNNINYKKIENVIFNNHIDIVLNKGMGYIDRYMKSYEQEKKGLSFAYHKRIVQNDGITTKPLNI